MNNTVMVVDDKKVNIDMLTNILRQDYGIMAATSGEYALKIMERKLPDMVLLDVYMPGMDGMTVLSQMKEQPRLSGIPVIFVTGEHDENMEEKGLMLGAVDYIKKPYNASIVKYKVRNQLEFKAYRDHLELVVEERTQQLAASREAIIMGMSLMSECHDQVTGDHIERIKRFTKIMCNKMHEMYPELMTKNQADAIVLYSTLHDVGKVAISDGILKKQGKLTDEEFSIMQSHTVNGAQLLRKTEQFLMDGENSSDISIAIEIAEGHHEKYDGTGYPNRLKGDDIPISARIVSIADIYDALRSPRPYKEPFTHQEASDILLKGDGRTMPHHFDPKALEIFASVLDEFDKAYH